MPPNIAAEEGCLLPEKNEMELQCYPLYSLMLSLNMTNIDLLSIDIQGFEILILETLPLTQLNLKVS